MREERQRLRRYLLLLILLVVDFGQPVSTQEIINQIYRDVGCVDHPCDPCRPILLFSPLPFVPSAPCGVGTGIGLFILVLMAILAVLLEQLYAKKYALRSQVNYPNNTPHYYQLVSILWQKCKKALPLLFTLFAVGVVALLLTLSGDVEQNPGPPTKQGTPIPKVPSLMRVLVNGLHEIATNWRTLGVQLEVPTSQLDGIGSNNSNVSDRLEAVLVYWMNNTTHTTINALVDAIRSPSIANQRLASSLEHELQTLYLRTVSFNADEKQEAASCDSPHSCQRRSQDQLGPQRHRNEGQSPSESLNTSEATLSSCTSSQESSFDPNPMDIQPVLECGCGECTPASYAMKGCPKGTLPFLKCDGLSEDELEILKTTLTQGSKDINKQFQLLVSATFSATKDMPVQEFLVHLMSLQVPNKSSGLPFEDRFAEIESAPNVATIFLIFRDYISFFDYDIIEVIICSVSQEGDQLYSQLLSYKEAFEKYCERRVFECPPQIGTKGNIKQAKFVMKIDAPVNYTLGNVRSFRNQVAEICQVSASALRLGKLEEGCIKVTFLMPSFLKDEMFPFSKEQKQALTDLGVVKFYEVLEKAPNPPVDHVAPASLPPSTKDIPASPPPTSENIPPFPQSSTKDSADSPPITTKDIPAGCVKGTKRQISDRFSSIAHKDCTNPQVETDALSVCDTLLPVSMKKHHPFPEESQPAVKDATTSDDSEEQGASIMPGKPPPEGRVKGTKRQISDRLSSIAHEVCTSPQGEADALYVCDTLLPVSMKKHHPFPEESQPTIKDANTSDDNEEQGASGSVMMSGKAPPEASQTQHQAPSEFNFANPPSDKYFCPIIGELLLTPLLTTCCGKHISHLAVSNLQQAICPFCRKDLSTVLDKSFQRKVRAIKVRCQHAGEGCTWIGDLSDYEGHLSINNIDGKCQYVEVTCPWSCGECVQRHYLEQHKSQCLKRPYTCQYCPYEATYEEVINTHTPVCEIQTTSCPQKCGKEEIEHKNLQEHLRNCPKQVVPCEYYDAGCLVKVENQEMPAHMQNSIQDHLFKVTQQNKELIKENKALIEQNKKLKENNEMLTSIQDFHSPSTVPIPLGPPEFIMTGFGEHNRLGDKWFSPPFYTSMGGYRMCLRVRAHGRGTLMGTHVGVSVRLMTGQYDDSLRWPFRGKITLQLVNQRRDKGHIEKTVLFEDSLSDEYSGRVVGLDHERAERGRGFDIIAHADLPYNCAEDTEYLKNDSIIFRVKEVVVHSK